MLPLLSRVPSALQLVIQILHRSPSLIVLVAPRGARSIVGEKRLHENLERELVTEDELMAQLRVHGQDSTRNVVKAFVEGDGHVSVILRSGRETAAPAEHRGSA